MPIGAGGEDGVSKVVAVADRADGGIKGDRADGADVEASNIIFAPNIRPLERRRHSATKPGYRTGQHVKADSVSPVVDGMEVFEFKYRPDGVDVPAQNAPGELHAGGNVFSGVGIIGIVHGVELIGGRNLAAHDPRKGVGPLKPAEVQRLEECLRGRVEGRNAADRQAVGESHAGEAAAQRIACKPREAGGVLLEVLSELRVGRGLQQGGVDARQQGRLPQLVVLEIRVEDRESGGDGLVPEIGLGESEGVGLLEGPPFGVDAQCFAEPQEIVRGVVQTDEISRVPADPPLKADGVAALLLHL